MDDMINMVMFTIEATSSHVMIGCGVVDLDRVSLNNQRDVEFSGSSLRWTKIIINKSPKMSLQKSLKIMVDYGSLFVVEKLRLDGSFC